MVSASGLPPTIGVYLLHVVFGETKELGVRFRA